MTVTPKAGSPEPAVTLPPLLLRRIDREMAAQPVLDLLTGQGTAPRVARNGTADALLFTLSDLAGATDEPLAAATTIVVRAGTVEVQSLAVRPGLPYGLVAARLLAALADWLRADGWRVVVIDTGADERWTAALSAAGFTAPEACRAQADGRLELTL